MTVDYKALAERIEHIAATGTEIGVELTDEEVADLRTVVSLLDGMADAPAMWVQSNHLSWAGKQPSMARCAPTQLHPDFVPVYLRPAPQPQPEPTEAQIEAAAIELFGGADLEYHRSTAERALRAAFAAKEK